jgi:hypothetical protein
VLSQVTEDYPTIILSDISPQDIKSIIEFVYHGEIRVPVENINSLLEAARSLKISGLIDVSIKLWFVVNYIFYYRLSSFNLPYTYLEVGTLACNNCSLYFQQIDGVEENEIVRSKNSVEEAVTEAEEIENNVEQSLENDLHEQNTAENCISNKKKKRRRETVKRDYNDDMLASAINDLKLGQTLIEAATKHNIPRSTLYMRAKALGIHLNASRNGYPTECMNAAINAVIS